MRARTHTDTHTGNFIIPLCCEKLGRSHSGSEKWIIFSVSPSWVILSHGDERKPSGVRARACRELKDPDETGAQPPRAVRRGRARVEMFRAACLTSLWFELSVLGLRTLLVVMVGRVDLCSGGGGGLGVAVCRELGFGHMQVRCCDGGSFFPPQSLL